MKMELGSDFELDTSELSEKEDSIYNYLSSFHAVYTDSGRSALVLLNKKIKSGTILLPAYLCESVLDVYRGKFPLRFYQIKKDLSIDYNDFESKLDRDVSVVYLLHYFGQLQSDDFLQLLNDKKQKYGFTIIEDTTHSIFTKSRTIGDYCICSLRKWFPIPDGGVLYSSDKTIIDFMKNVFPKSSSNRLDAMILKKWYIDGKVDSNSLYRKIFIEEESKLGQQQNPYLISGISGELLKCYSVTQLKERRKYNYKEISKALTQKHIKQVLKETDIVPLTCPIFVDQRDLLREYLIKNQVYCAVHWPIDGRLQNEKAVEISSHILSLPIDQRYGLEHMAYLRQMLENYYNQSEI